MADFCLQCNSALFDINSSDHDHPDENPPELKEGWGYSVICEGCGYIQVDNEGKCISFTKPKGAPWDTTGCLQNHNPDVPVPEWMNEIMAKLPKEPVAEDISFESIKVVIKEDDIPL